MPPVPGSPAQLFGREPIADRCRAKRLIDALRPGRSVREIRDTELRGFPRPTFGRTVSASVSNVAFAMPGR